MQQLLEHLAPLPDVLTEQFEYLLLVHGGECVTAQCPDCKRFEELKALLLARFEADHYHRELPVLL